MFYVVITICAVIFCLINKYLEKKTVSDALPFEAARPEQSFWSLISTQLSNVYGWVIDDLTHFPPLFIRGRGEFVAPTPRSWGDRTIPNLGRAILYRGFQDMCFRLPICCFIMKPERFKDDLGRKSWPNFGLIFSLRCKNWGKGWAKCLSEFIKFKYRTQPLILYFCRDAAARAGRLNA